jgi:hypothetical protein
MFDGYDVEDAERWWTVKSFVKAEVCSIENQALTALGKNEHIGVLTCPSGDREVTAVQLWKSSGCSKVDMTSYFLPPHIYYV